MWLRHGEGFVYFSRRLGEARITNWTIERILSLKEKGPLGPAPVRGQANRPITGQKVSAKALRREVVILGWAERNPSLIFDPQPVFRKRYVGANLPPVIEAEDREDW
jgi:hypothetical protein